MGSRANIFKYTYMHFLVAILLIGSFSSISFSAVILPEDLDAPSAVKFQPKLLTRAYAGDARAQFEVCKLEVEKINAADERGFDWCILSARNLYAPAQAFVGEEYSREGSRVKNLEKSLKWLFAAAKQGNAGALYSLSAMYLYGEGVHPDQLTANDYMEKAAALGHAKSQGMIGYSYLTGKHGRIQDLDRAVEWLKLGAKNGDGFALLVLSDLYADGRGVKKNIGYAYILASLALAAGNPRAKEPRDSYRAKLSAEQVRISNTHAQDWRIGSPLPID
jgi:TPR repeat protein